MSRPAARPHPDDLDLVLGHPGLDAEHRTQFGLIDAIADQVARGAPAREVDAALGRLIEYVRMHFLSEQLLMEHHRFPEREQHAREHDQAVELLEDLRRRHALGVARWTLDSLHLLRDWLAGHVRGPDRSLARFLVEANAPEPRA